MKRLVGAALLLAVIFLFIRYYELPNIREEDGKKRLFGETTASEIKKISVVHGEDRFGLVNRDPKKAVEIDPSEGVTDSSAPTKVKTSWNLEGQPGALLDAGSVESLAGAVAQAQISQTIKAEEQEPDLSVYGLDKPELVLSVTGGDDKERTVQLGKENDFVSLRYAKVVGDPNLYLINEAVFEAANKKSFEFRDKTPISFGDEAVRQVSLKSATAPEIVIEPKEDKTFRLIKPIAVQAQNFAVFDLYRNLRNLQADLFIDSPEAPATYGLDNPAARISVTTSEGPLQIAFGSKGEKEFFQLDGAGTVYQAVGHPLTAMAKGVDSFRDLQQFTFDHYIVNKFVVLKSGSPYLILQKDGEGWKVNDAPADAPFVRQYLRDVSELRVASFLPVEDAITKQTGGGLYTVTVTTQGGSETKTQTLEIGNKRGDIGYPAIVKERGEPFVLTQEKVNLIVPALEKFRPVVEPTPTNVATP